MDGLQQNSCGDKIRSGHRAVKGQRGLEPSVAIVEIQPSHESPEMDGWPATDQIMHLAMLEIHEQAVLRAAQLRCQTSITLDGKKVVGMQVNSSEAFSTPPLVAVVIFVVILELLGKFRENGGVVYPGYNSRVEY
jgi:hypothetical protein